MHVNITHSSIDLTTKHPTPQPNPNKAGVSIQRVASIRAQLKRHPTPPPVVTASPSAPAEIVDAMDDDHGPYKPQPPQPPQAPPGLLGAEVEGKQQQQQRRLSRSGSGVNGVRRPLVKEVVVLSDGQEVALNWFPTMQPSQQEGMQQVCMAAG